MAGALRRAFVADPSITPDGQILAYERGGDIYISTRACL
jgi:hypothetical protein